MLASVPRATLVIANPTHYAIALKYQHGEDVAPTVLAKGQDLIALKIREIAESNNVPVIEDRMLARAMYDAAMIDQVIPAEFFRPVAEIIYFMHSRKKKANA
jgi:flagellar biosynthetic protein FlhB